MFSCDIFVTSTYERVSNRLVSYVFITVVVRSLVQLCIYSQQNVANGVHSIHLSTYVGHIVGDFNMIKRVCTC